MNRQDAHMPGCWICPKCGFVLQKSVICTGDSSIRADDSPLNEKCPNEGQLMRPYTWREANEDLFKRCSEQITEIGELKGRIAEMEATLAAMIQSEKQQ